MANPQSNLDELMKDPKAAGLLKNKALLQSLMQSPDTQRLMELLSQNAGDGLKTAAAILSDPQAMGQIASLAQALTGEHTGESAPPPAAEPAEAGPAGEAAGQAGATDWSALLGMLGGGGDSNPLSALSELDPQLLQAGLRLFSEYSATDDRKVALLNALKPFVKPERYAKVDKAVQIAKLARVIRVAFQLFQSRREEGKDDV